MVHIQHDFDVNFNNILVSIFFNIISSYNKYYNDILKKKFNINYSLHTYHQSHDVLSITLIFSLSQYA